MAPVAPLEFAPVEGAPDLAGLGERLGPGSSRLKSVRDLHAWLRSLDPSASLEARCERLEAGARWLRVKGPIPQREAVALDEPAPTRRLRLLLLALDAAPAYAARLRELVRSVLEEAPALGLYEAGLPNPRGVGAETSDRLARRFLPTADGVDLLAVVGLLFPTGADVDWLESLPLDLIGAAGEALGVSLPGAAALDALLLAAGRASNLGLTAELRARSTNGPLRDSPFFRLPRACDALVAHADAEAALAVESLVAACRAECQVVLGHLEDFGVSVDVVYRLEVIGRNLDRLDQLVELLLRPGAAPGRALLVTVGRARLRDRNLRDLVRSNARLIGRKIVERAGSTGEHYITRTRREWLGMIASAGGGGVLTAFTAAFKQMVVLGHLPLFIEGLLSSTNYAVSFLLMQLFGFTLATKQPSMTAAALAGAVREGRGDASLEPLVTAVARICRSQLAAAIGNVGMVIPAAFLFNLYWQHHSGHPYLDEHAAEHVLESLSPRSGWNLFFAALTGVILWSSSLCAGWLENWSTYRRLPEAIAQHRLGRIVGRDTMRWLAKRLQHGIAGIGGNVSIGVLLGMVPVFGKFLGVPLEVRHLTLSTGSLSLALASTGWRDGALAAAAGIVAIGLFNFGVSFVLALAVALRAREVEQGGWRLSIAVLRRFVRSPLGFFYPNEG